MSAHNKFLNKRFIHRRATADSTDSSSATSSPTASAVATSTAAADDVSSSASTNSITSNAASTTNSAVDSSSTSSSQAPTSQSSPSSSSSSKATTPTSSSASPTSTPSPTSTSTTSSSSSSSSVSSASSTSSSTSSTSSHSSSSSLSSSSSSSAPSTTPTTLSTSSVSSTSSKSSVSSISTLPTTSIPSTSTVPTFSYSSLTSSTTPSASSSSTSSGSVDTAAIVGGIAGTLGGLVLLSFLAMFFMRRCRRRRDDDHFDADAFKRQSTMLLDDPPLSSGAPENDILPRRPTMSQRGRLADTVPVYESAYGNEQQSYLPSYDNHAGFGTNTYGNGSYTPGYPTTSPPPPAEVYAPYGQSPVGSPTSVPYYDSAYDQNGQLVRQPSNGGYLTRQKTTMGSPLPLPVPSPAPTLGAPYATPDPTSAHYVDLSRSSVTPFQAQQYAEISRKLNEGANHGQGNEEADGDGLLPSPYDESFDAGGDHGMPTSPEPAFHHGVNYHV